jgi:thioredoxin-dependent peroxiredoxin
MIKKSILILAIFFSALVMAYAQAPLQVGDIAPVFSGTADDGSNWNVEDYLGKKIIVVYFYPAAMTGGCTAQACTYRDFHNDIQDADALVVGVSGDNVDGLKLFKKAHDLNFTLLSDKNGDIAKEFGVPTRDGGTISRELAGEFYELTRGVTASRWTFIIDKDKKILYKNEEVNAERDTEQVLSFIKKQKASM